VIPCRHPGIGPLLSGIISNTKAMCQALLVIPVQAGIQQLCGLSERYRYWIPACAGMTHPRSRRLS
jgi:hypothetical protein